MVAALRLGRGAGRQPGDPDVSNRLLVELCSGTSLPVEQSNAGRLAVETAQELCPRRRAGARAAVRHLCALVDDGRLVVALGDGRLAGADVGPGPVAAGRD